MQDKELRERVEIISEAVDKMVARFGALRIERCPKCTRATIHIRTIKREEYTHLYHCMVCGTVSKQGLYEIDK